MNLIQIKQVGDLRSSLDSLSTAIYQTGEDIVAMFNSNQTLAGDKIFQDEVEFNTGVRVFGDLTGQNVIFNENLNVQGVITQGSQYIPLLRYPPPSTEISVGNSGDVSYNSEFFYVCTGVNQWGRIPFSGWA